MLQTMRNSTSANTESVAKERSSKPDIIGKSGIWLEKISDFWTRLHVDH